MDFATLSIQSSTENFEIFIAELAELGFDTFLEGEEQLSASISIDKYAPDAIQNLLKIYDNLIDNHAIIFEEKQNWNKLWEDNFDPVFIGNSVIRASFHKLTKTFDYEVVINPKMSFGTGHHETTYLMSKFVLEHNIEEAEVFDAGCGTGILGILSDKRGAKKIIGCDIEEWAVENCQKNIELNSSSMSVCLGTANEIDKFHHGLFDVLLANINLNVIIEEIPTYAALCKEGGYIALSGFYVQDIDTILEHTQRLGLSLMGQNEKKNWCMLYFQKS